MFHGPEHSLDHLHHGKQAPATGLAFGSGFHLQGKLDPDLCTLKNKYSAVIWRSCSVNITQASSSLFVLADFMSQIWDFIFFSKFRGEKYSLCVKICFLTSPSFFRDFNHTHTHTHTHTYISLPEVAP